MLDISTPDAVQSADDPLKFYLYELYVDEDALAYHNEQPYLKDVVTFVQGGGAVIEVKKAVGKFMTEWWLYNTHDEICGDIIFMMQMIK